MCTTGDTAHIDTIFKFLPHTRQRVWQELEYRIVGRSFGFLVINVCNHGEYYETPCILSAPVLKLYNACFLDHKA